jgi:hypothetical protein
VILLITLWGYLVPNALGQGAGLRRSKFGTPPRPSPFVEMLQTEEPMPRFFFHVIDGSTFKDEDGENLPSIESARAHAARRRDGHRHIQRQPQCYSRRSFLAT